VSTSLNFLAIDLGAESGRAVLGTLANDRIALQEVHRFPNGPVRVSDGIHWDALRLWSEIKAGMSRAVREHGGDLAGIGLDTWGVDFGLLDRQGVLLGNPYHYRDNRADGMVEEAFRRMPRTEIFRRTGIQFMQLNSLYQLLAMVVQQSPVLDVAHTFLTMPDLFNYWLTGRKVCEFTNATTTQCYDPCEHNWSKPLLDAMGIPSGMFPEIVQPGTLLGPLTGDLAEEIGAHNLSVIAPPCHDTGSAVAAVPASDADFAWISSGTWSIMGTETREPVINAESLKRNFTNEGGVEGTFRFSKNINGLWLVQECRRTWAAQGQTLSYDDITALASAARPFVAVLDPDAEDFLKPCDMPAQIRAYCERTGQTVPATQGEVLRTALESLALKYRWVLERTEEMTGRHYNTIHIVGGGTKNHLLSQLAADATGRVVVTGPVEATAMGNIMVQAMALGHIGSLAEGRAIVRNSSEMLTYEPHSSAAWDEAYGKLVALLKA
jgi:rhamnulokinase